MQSDMIHEEIIQERQEAHKELLQIIYSTVLSKYLTLQEGEIQLTVPQGRTFNTGFDASSSL